MTTAGSPSLAREEHVLGVGAEPVGHLGQQAHCEPTHDEQQRHADALLAVRDGESESTNHYEYERGEHTDGDR
jgi:hypothetical protein